MKFEDYLAPWEKDKDGKKLDEPAEIDGDKLKKYLFNLENDKDQLQEKVKTTETERDQAKDQLATVQQEHENDEQRRAREAKEQTDRMAKFEAESLERKKLDAITDAFPGITAARAKRLAKRVTSTDESAWVDDAKELVEDGFRVNEKTETEETVETEETFETRPKVVRSNGGTVTVAASKKLTPADELEAAGIFRDSY